MFDFLLHVLIMACLYGMLALSLNLQAGFGGLMNFGQIALFGCGAYGAALAFRYDLGFAAGILLAAVLVTAAAWAFAGIGRNLQSDYWGIATLALAEVIRIIITNEGWLTGGAQGVSGIRPLFPALEGRTQQFANLAVCAGALLAAFLAARRLTGSKYGLGLKLMREEPELAQSLGYDVMALKRGCMIFSGLIAAGAGFLFAHYITFAGPDQLFSSETFLIWAMIVIGGMGNHFGAVFGAFLLQFIFAFIPFVKDMLGMPTEFVAAVRLFLIGGGLIAFILWRRTGLFPEHAGGQARG